MHPPADLPRPRGILAGVARLDAWSTVVLVVLTAASALRYLTAHGLDGRAPVVLAGAGLLLAGYAAGRRLPHPARWAPAWCLALVLLWLALVVLAPSFAWVAVPLSFVALRVLPFLTAVATIAVMTTTVVVAWTLMAGELDPTTVAGPVCIASLTVVAYRALERAAAARSALLDELREAQGDLAEAQHTAGVLAERTRLSRDIHDSIGQALSSINLLLQAAEQAWTHSPDAARRHVGQAAATARDGLADVRRVIADLAPPELAGHAGPALVAALRRACERAVQGSGVRVEVRVDGAPVEVPGDVATALVHTARGALANVVEHAGARSAVVSLSYQPDAVTLDVRDDGAGFVPGPGGGDGRGRGLPGIRARAEQFGGALAVESAPGEGTVLAVSLPLGGRDGR